MNTSVEAVEDQPKLDRAAQMIKGAIEPRPRWVVRCYACSRERTAIDCTTEAFALVLQRDGWVAVESMRLLCGECTG